jgi:hypothetical protein
MTNAIIGAVLFVLLTPDLILRIPSKGPLLNALVVHAVVFGILFYVICKLVYQYSANRESFLGGGGRGSSSKSPPLNSDYVYGTSASKKVVWTGKSKIKPAADDPCWQITTKDNSKINGTDAKIEIDGRKYAHCNYSGGPDVRLSNQL